MLTLCFLQNSIVCPKTLFQGTDLNNSFTSSGHFSRWSFWVPTTLCYLQNWMFCLITSCFYVDLEASLRIKLICVPTHFYRSIPFSAVNSIFLTFSDVPTTLCYLQNWTFHPLFLFISILFALCLHKPYFSLFKCNFDSLNNNFELTILCRLRDFFKD